MTQPADRNAVKFLLATVVQIARATARLVPLMALALTSVNALSASRQDRADAESLTTAILAHVRLSLPPSASRSVEAEYTRLNSFAMTVMAEWVYPEDPATLQATAIDAIDKTSNPTATADALVRAAINAMSVSVGSHGTMCEQCGETRRARGPPTNVQMGAMRVIALHDLNMHEALEHKPCSAFDHYFEFPPEGVTGLILDLRGNQGGFLAAAICVAGEFLKPKAPLFRIVSRAGEETEASPTNGRRTPITVPMVVFVDRDTESGALALAASLRDAGRANLIGESKEHANGTILAQVTTRTGQDTYLLAVGYIKRLGGAPLAEGLQVDIAASPNSDDAMLDAARARFGDSAR